MIWYILCNIFFTAWHILKSVPLPHSQLTADCTAFTAGSFLCCCSLCSHVKQVGAEVAWEPLNLQYLNTNTDAASWCSGVLKPGQVTAHCCELGLTHHLWYSHAVCILRFQIYRPSLNWNLSKSLFSFVSSHPAGQPFFANQFTS